MLDVAPLGGLGAGGRAALRLLVVSGADHKRRIRGFLLALALFATLEWHLAALRRAMLRMGRHLPAVAAMRASGRRWASCR